MSDTSASEVSDTYCILSRYLQYARADMHSLTQPEILRYSRQLLLPEIGTAGQALLKRASVIIIGVGGLGSPVGLYLAAAGVGRIGLVDGDTVELTNLHRQLLYTEADLGREKVMIAAARLQAVNPHVALVPQAERLTATNASRLLADYDVVIDGTDNFAARYLINDACVFLKKPNIHGSIFRFEGQATLFDATRGPCYRCLYPEPPAAEDAPSCAEAGVFGVLPGLIGLIQATETIKWIVRKGTTLVGRLLLFDALAMRFRELTIPKDLACPVCGRTPTIRSLADGAVAYADRLCAADADAEITPRELQQRLGAGEQIALIDVREPEEFAICRLAGAQLIPLGELSDHLGTLNQSAPIVVYCHHGVRSMNAVQQLHAAGRARARSLAGGIQAWAEVIDPTMPQY